MSFVILQIHELES